jgi:hypothetical protein
VHESLSFALLGAPISGHFAKILLEFAICGFFCFRVWGSLHRSILVRVKADPTSYPGSPQSAPHHSWVRRSRGRHLRRRTTRKHTSGALSPREAPPLPPPPPRLALSRSTSLVTSAIHPHLSTSRHRPSSRARRTGPHRSHPPAYVGAPPTIARASSPRPLPSTAMPALAGQRRTRIGIAAHRRARQAPRLRWGSRRREWCGSMVA